MTIAHLPVLVLNAHTRCNCRCTMCDIWKDPLSQEMDASALAAQMESIGRLGVEWVVLTGGEPLMHSNLWRLCSLIRSRGVRITLLSSGLLLHRHAPSIVEYVDDVIVSVDGPPPIHDRIRGISRAFELLSQGVAEIRRLRPEFGISARCTIQNANLGYLAATVNAASQLHLDSLSFLAVDLKSKAFNRPLGWPQERTIGIALDAIQTESLACEIESLIDSGICGKFVLESPAKLRRIVNHFRAHLGQTSPVAPRCNAPWNSAVVEVDGTVRPCFFHPSIGHLDAGHNLEQVLNGPIAAAFRHSLDIAANPICQRCVCSLNWEHN